MPSGVSRFLGMGFLIGAKDDAATKTTDEVREAIDKLSESADAAGKQGAKGVDTLSRAVESLPVDKVDDAAAAFTTASDTIVDDAQRQGDAVERVATSFRTVSEDVSDSTEMVSDDVDRMADATERGTRRVTTAIDAVGNSAEDVGERGRDGIGLFSRALDGLQDVNIANISDRLDDLAERSSTGIGLQSTGVESFGVQFSQTYRQMTAGLGQFRGQVDEMRGAISAAAYNYDVDAGEMLGATIRLARSGRSLEDYGVSMRGMVGMMQSGAMSAEDLANVMLNLSESYDLGADGARNLMDRITALGERAGAGADAVRAMPQVMQAIDDVAARFPEIGHNVDTATESIMRLAIAQQTRLGTDFQTGVQSAIGVFNELAGAREEMTRLVTGLGGDFPELATQIGISMDDVQGSLEAVMQDPVRFAQSMRQLMGSLDESDPRARRLRLALAGMGDDFNFLVQGGEEADRALAAATESIENTEGAFNRMGESAAGTSRTMEEQIQRMQDQFQNRLNQIGRATDRGFVARQARAYQRVGGIISDFAADRGPLGALTRGFLRVRTFGLVNGLFPQLGVLTDGFGDVFTSMGPVMRTLGDTGILRSLRDATAASTRFGAALRLVGRSALIATGIGAVAVAGYYLVTNWERVSAFLQRLPAVLQRAANSFADWAAGVQRWVSSIDWAGIGQRFVRGLGDVVRTAIDFFTGGDVSGRMSNAITDTFLRGIRSLGAAVYEAVRELGGGMFDALIEGITGQSGLGLGVMDTVLTVLNDVRGVIYSIGINNPLMLAIRGISTVMGALSDVMEPVFTAMRDNWPFIEDAVQAVLRALVPLVGEITGLRSSGQGLYVDFIQPLVRGFADLISSPVAGLFERIGTSIRNTMGPLARGTAELLPQFAHEVERFAPMITAIGSAVITAGEAFATVFGQIFRDAASLGDTFSTLFGDVQEEGGQTARSMTDLSNRSSGEIRRGIITVAHDFIDYFGRMLAVGLDTFSRLTSGGINMFYRLRAGIQSIVSTWRSLQDLMSAGWDFVGDSISAVMTRITVTVRSTFMEIRDAFELGFLRLQMVFAESFTGVLQTISNVVSMIPPQLLGGALAGFPAAIQRAQRSVTEMTRVMGEAERSMLETQQDRREQARLEIAAADSLAAQSAQRVVQARSEWESTQRQIFQDNETRRRAAQQELAQGVAALTNAGQAIETAVDQTAARIMAGTTVMEMQEEQRAAMGRLVGRLEEMGGSQARQTLQAIQRAGEGGRVFSATDVDRMTALVDVLSRRPERGQAGTTLRSQQQAAWQTLREVTTGREVETAPGRRSRLVRDLPPGTPGSPTHVVIARVTPEAARTQAEENERVAQRAPQEIVIRGRRQIPPASPPQGGAD